MPKVVAAVWEPDANALDAWRSNGAIVRRALEDQGYLSAGSPFDALVTVWSDAPDALAVSDLGARVSAWVVEERRPKASDDVCAVTMVALARRAPSLTHEEFAAHWTQRHTPLALEHHVGLADYIQNVVERTLTSAAEDVDGIAELGFVTREDFETRFFDSDDGRRVIGEDVRRFMAGPGPDSTLLAPPT